MYLIGSIEKLINEKGSAKILKERLLLVRDQLEDLERKNEALETDLKLAEAKALVLSDENKKLKSQIKALEEIEAPLSDEKKRIIAYLFEYADAVSADFVSYELKMKQSLVEYHFDTLKKLRYIRQTRTQMRTADFSISGPAFSLTSEGREAYMQEANKSE